MSASRLVARWQHVACARPPELSLYPHPSPSARQLRDVSYSDHLGRKVTVEAPSRALALHALDALLFQLRHSLKKDTRLEGSRWLLLSPVRARESAPVRRQGPAGACESVACMIAARSVSESAAAQSPRPPGSPGSRGAGR